MVKHLPRIVWILSLVSLFTDIASEMLYPIMPAYLASIGFGIGAISLLEGISEAIAGLGKSYFGALSDRSGQRLIFVRGGYALSALGKIVMPMSHALGVVFGARFADRLGKGLRTGARDALLASSTGVEHTTSVFGFHRAMDTLGAAIGPFIALVMLAYFPGRYVVLLWMAAIPGVIAVGLTYLLREPTTTKRVGKKNFFEMMGYLSRASQGYRWLFGLAIVFALVNSADALLLLALKNMGYGDTQVIGMYIGYNIIYALLAYPIARLADRYGVVHMVIVGLLLFATVYFFIGQSVGLYWHGALFAVYGVYGACYESGVKSMCVRLSDKDEHATAIGFYSGWASISAMVAASWTALVWKMWGCHTAFVISAVVALLVAMSMWYVKRRGLLQL